MPERIEVLRNVMGASLVPMSLTSPIPSLAAAPLVDPIGAPFRPARRSKRLRRTECHLAPSEVDMTSCENVRQFFQRCGEVVREDAPRHLIVDLEAVDRVDTKLVASLVALHRLASVASVQLDVRVSSAVRDVLKVCRLERLAESTCTV
jgi:anti-anti-sigma regulatory factor